MNGSDANAAEKETTPEEKEPEATPTDQANPVNTMA